MVDTKRAILRFGDKWGKLHGSQRNSASDELARGLNPFGAFLLWPSLFKMRKACVHTVNEQGKEDRLGLTHFSPNRKIVLLQVTAFHLHN